MDKCVHCVGEIEKNEIGEDICFCELSGKTENITLGDCLDNCESQEAKHVYVVIKNEFGCTKILGVFEKINSELINGSMRGKYVVLECDINVLLTPSEATPV